MNGYFMSLKIGGLVTIQYDFIDLTSMEIILVLYLRGKFGKILIEKI